MTPNQYFCVRLLKEAGLLPETGETNTHNYAILPPNESYLVHLHPTLVNLQHAGNLNQTSYEAAIDFIAKSNKTEMDFCAAFLTEHGLMTAEFAPANRALIAKCKYNVSYLYSILVSLQQVGILTQNNIRAIEVLIINSEFDFNAFSRSIFNLRMLGLLKQENYSAMLGILISSKVPAALITLITLNPSRLKHKLSAEYFKKFLNCAFEVDYNHVTEKSRYPDLFIDVMKMLLTIEALHPKNYKLLVQNALTVSYVAAIFKNIDYAETLAIGIGHIASVEQTILLDTYYKLIIANPAKADLLGAAIAVLSKKDLLENRGRCLCGDPRTAAHLAYVFLVMNNFGQLTADLVDSIIQQQALIIPIFTGIKILKKANIVTPRYFYLMISDAGNAIQNANRIVQGRLDENIHLVTSFFAPASKRRSDSGIKKETEDNKRYRGSPTP
jgi:hypothetical protein